MRAAQGLSGPRRAYQGRTEALQKLQEPITWPPMFEPQFDAGERKAKEAAAEVNRQRALLHSMRESGAHFPGGMAAAPKKGGVGV
ncbi:MAG: hypothetical protein ACRCV9_00625 [Burkholderiaceae bacterium]